LPARALWPLLVLTLSSVACSPKPKRGELAPFTEKSWSTSLEVKGFGPATVALPLGAKTARPIVVVLHGARDKPEWQCGTFRGLLGPSVFVLCPQGIAAGDGLYGIGSFDDATAELRAGLAALKAKYAPYVAPSPIVLFGYGEGAAVAADLARQEPSFFARVALVNGSPASWSSSATKIFAERGGKRVLFFCGTRACDDSGAERTLWLTRAGASAKSVKHDVGPYLDQRMVDALRGELPWLLEGDARFGQRH
jgi:predicted esterase